MIMSRKKTKSENGIVFKVPSKLSGEFVFTFTPSGLPIKSSSERLLKEWMFQSINAL